MTAQSMITLFLGKNRGQPYCDDCLSKGLGIKPRQQVQQKTSILGKLRGYKRGNGYCSRCHSERVVIQAVTALADVRTPRRKAEVPAASPPTSIASHRLRDHSGAELERYKSIQTKDQELRKYLDKNGFPNSMDTRRWLSYLNGVKHVLGNLNNDLSFLATVLVKQYLEHRFSIIDFDAGEKAQSAPGIDVVAKTPDGSEVVGEIKTTKPYQPGFGAAQRSAIIKDLLRMAASTAKHRFMFVTDPDAYKALSNKSLMSCAPGVEVVNLATGESFICER